jgi:hypothetical protein
VFQGGSIFIELMGNNIGLIAGQIIQGTVHVNQQMPFEAQNLTVALHGIEFTHFRKVHRHGKTTSVRWHTGSKEIIHLVYPISHWPDG